MIEIIPNWHPVLVHFTVALLSLTVVFHLLGLFMPEGGLKQQFETLADWNLWLGTAFGIITAIAGWFAANSVVHDEPAHVAMMDHRNWGLAALALFVALSVYSLWRNRRGVRPGYVFLGVLVVAGVILGGTAWRGAEVVYRHGVGVMSLPQPEAGGHDHATHDHESQGSVDPDEKAVTAHTGTGHHDLDSVEHEAVVEVMETESENHSSETTLDKGHVTEGITEEHDHSDHAH